MTGQTERQFCRLRKFLGWTQFDVQVRTGIHRQRVSAAETGRTHYNETEQRVLAIHLTRGLQELAERDGIDLCTLTAEHRAPRAPVLVFPS